MSDQIQNRSIKVERTAHYATLGTISSKTKYVWIACHGYGQLAKHFIRKFDVLANDEVFIVAPEGLSKFYWEGVGFPNRKVVASWMTRENRLDEIADYCQMLDQLYQLYIPKAHPEVKIILMGFSQGCATQARWMHQNQVKADVMVTWGGIFPEDLDYTIQKEYWSALDLHFVYGLQDEYLSPGRQEKYQQFLREQELDLKIHTFDGTHVVKREVLATLAKEIYQKHPVD